MWGIDAHWGIFDNTGNVILPQTYDFISLPISHHPNPQFVAVNTGGAWVMPEDSVNGYEEILGGYWGIWDADTRAFLIEPVLPFERLYLLFDGGNFAHARVNGKWGVIRIKTK